MADGFKLSIDTDAVVDSSINSMDFEMMATYKVLFDQVCLTGTNHMLEVVKFAIEFSKMYPNCTSSDYILNSETRFFISQFDKMAKNGSAYEIKAEFLKLLETLEKRIRDNIKLNFDIQAKKEKEEREKKEKERQEKAKIDAIKKELLNEILLGREEIGNLTPQVIQEDYCNLCSQNFDVLVEHLKLLEQIYVEEIKKKGKYKASEYSAMIYFCMAKKIYAFAIHNEWNANLLNNEIGYFFDLRGAGHAKKEELFQIVTYISLFNKDHIIEHYQKYADLFAVITIFLFGGSAYSIQVLKKLVELKNKSGMNNASLDDLLEDLYIFNAIADGTTYRKSTQRPFRIERIITLAKEYAYFSRVRFDIDDEELRKPYIIDALKKVEQLFLENGTSIGKYFKKRDVLQKHYFFSSEYNSGLDLFGRFIKTRQEDCSFIRGHKQYRIIDGSFFEEGLTDRTNIIDINNMVRPYRFIETRLAVYIRTLLEFYLIHAHDNEECEFKYDYDRDVKFLMSDKTIPEDIRRDYFILSRLIDSNEIRDTISHAIRLM